VPVREVLHYPHPALKATARAVELPVDGGEVERVAADLVDTMRSMSFTTGVAATQLGELVRIVAVDVTGHRRTTVCHGELVLVNPAVVSASDETEVGREGCLSIPHLTANVRRPVSVAVDAVDPSGTPVRVETEGFEARCLLHEIDHLDGILFLDRVDSLSTDVFRRKKYG
jgi:peptide deformylase